MTFIPGCVQTLNYSKKHMFLSITNSFIGSDNCLAFMHCVSQDPTVS